MRLCRLYKTQQQSSPGGYQAGAQARNYLVSSHTRGAPRVGPTPPTPNRDVFSCDWSSLSMSVGRGFPCLRMRQLLPHNMPPPILPCRLHPRLDQASPKPVRQQQSAMPVSDSCCCLLLLPPPLAVTQLLPLRAATAVAAVPPPAGAPASPPRPTTAPAPPPSCAARIPCHRPGQRTAAEPPRSAGSWRRRPA